MTTTVTTLPGLSELSGSYALDPAHTRIGFVARHAMVTKVRGAFGTFEGRAEVDGADLSRSTVVLTIEAASIDTGNEQRDGHLRSNDFLAMDQFPQITFTSTAVRPTGPEALEITGDLTVRGVTRPVTVPFTFEGAAVDPFGNERIGFEGATTISRQDSASPGTPRWRPVASWSATRSPCSSTSRPLGPPDRSVLTSTRVPQPSARAPHALSIAWPGERVERPHRRRTVCRSLA